MVLSTIASIGHWTELVNPLANVEDELMTYGHCSEVRLNLTGSEKETEANDLL